MHFVIGSQSRAWPFVTSSPNSPYRFVRMEIKTKTIFVVGASKCCAIKIGWKFLPPLLSSSLLLQHRGIFAQITVTTLVLVIVYVRLHVLLLVVSSLWPLVEIDSQTIDAVTDHLLWGGPFCCGPLSFDCWRWSTVDVLSWYGFLDFTLEQVFVGQRAQSLKFDWIERSFSSSFCSILTTFWLYRHWDSLNIISNSWIMQLDLRDNLVFPWESQQIGLSYGLRFWNTTQNVESRFLCESHCGSPMDFIRTST